MARTLTFNSLRRCSLWPKHGDCLLAACARYTEHLVPADEFSRPSLLGILAFEHQESVVVGKLLVKVLSKSKLMARRSLLTRSISSDRNSFLVRHLAHCDPELWLWTLSQGTLFNNFQGLSYLADHGTVRTAGYGWTVGQQLSGYRLQRSTLC